MESYSSGSKLIRNLVILGDFVLLNMLMLAFLQFFPEIVPRTIKDTPRFDFFFANLSLAVAEFFFHTIIHERRVSFDQIAVRALKMVLTHAAIFFILSRMYGENGGYFRFILIYTPIMYLLVLASRIIELFFLSRYRQMGGNTRSVLFVGSDPANKMLYEEFMSDPSTGYLVKGYFSNQEIENAPSGLEYIGSLDDFDEICRNDTQPNNKIDELFCCLSHDESERISKIMQYCDKNVIRFYYVPRMQGNLRLNLIPERFGTMTLFTNYDEPLTKIGNRFLKRAFDIVFSLVVCLILLPFIPIIALIIKMQSPGPIFFVQKRTGMNGQEFDCYKFRSMHVNKDADIQQATLDDPRKFPFGNFMRKTNLDEFPQFFNVLIGNMSVVGPRPHMLKHTEIYSELIDKYMVRHFSKPGITGWAQVSGFRGETKELWQMEERIKRDIWYIENWSFWLDLRIIGKTFWSIIKPDKNAY
ncbi:MAG: undecaprenyl-phosphate glucose phosphotransferase [Prevotella sp.]|nr:undecaprenyl-phosphate glucose phosphotransferase [Prevotella sp.]